MNTHTEAIDLLLAVDPRHSILRIGEGLLEAAEDRRTQKWVTDAFEAVGDWLSNENQPIVTSQQMADWDRSRRRDGNLGLIEEADAQFLEPILVALYLRAKAALCTSTGMRFFGDLEENLKKVRPALEKISPETLGDILVETERSACRDPEFSKVLKAGAAEIAGLAPYLSSLEERGRTVLRRRGGGGGDDCACVIRACNGYGDCRNFCIGSWWKCLLIFLGIIIVIIILA